MKKIFSFTALFLVCVVSNAQTNYYWSGGEKIWLDTDSTQMVVKFDNEQSLRNFISLTPSATKLPAKSSLILVQQQQSRSNDETVERSMVTKIFAKKYRNTEIPFYLTGDVLLKPKDGISIEDILDKFGIDGQVRKKWSDGSVVVELNHWEVIMDIANTVYESGMVEWCHPDFATIIERTTADPLFSQQYYLKNTGQNSGTSGIDINVEPAWAITKGGNIRVAVIDDGVENHEDMDGRVLQGFTPLNSIGYGAPTTQNVPNVTFGHGQACAGIIAASHNTMGIAGIAPNVQIVPINVFHSWEYDQYSGWRSIETAQNIADAIDFAWNSAQGNASVISNSWNYGTTTNVASAVSAAINRALTQGRGGLGSVVVFSAGNYNQNFSGVAFPANVDGVIAVGAVNKNGTVWNYSSRGTQLSLVAPSGNTNLSGDITTTDRMGTNGYEQGNYTSRFGGTSAAAPQVAGIAALILSVRPDLHQSEVRNAIESTARNLPNHTPTTQKANGWWNNQVGYGLVDASAALFSVSPIVLSTYDDLCSSTPIIFSISNLPTGASAVTWQKSDDGIVLSNTSGYSTTASRNPSYPSGVAHTGWVKAVFTLSGQQVELIQDIAVGTVPDVSRINTQKNGTFQAVSTCTFTDVITYDNQIPVSENSYGITGGDWFLASADLPPRILITSTSEFNSVSGTGKNLRINGTAPLPISVQAVVKLQNHCGWSDWDTVEYYTKPCINGVPGPDIVPLGRGEFDIIASPNPVLGELTVDLLSLPVEAEVSAEGVSAPLSTYTVKLFDYNGKLHRESKFTYQSSDGQVPAVKFDTSNLSEGTYFLHIEGAGQVHKEQIIVKRK